MALGFNHFTCVVRKKSAYVKIRVLYINICVRACFRRDTQVWIFLGNEEVRERADGEEELARRRNKKKRTISRTSLLINP